MDKANPLAFLPINFRHEKKFLMQNGIDSWQDIRLITDLEINQFVQKECLCTESRFKKIRVIATFILDLNLNPHEAYLLLHSGIPSIEALSILNPDILEKKIRRLERILNTTTQSEINLALLKKWILKAKNLT